MFKVGQQVVCVAHKWGTAWDVDMRQGVHPSENELCTVIEALEGTIKVEGYEGWYSTEGFRPIQEPVFPVPTETFIINPLDHEGTK